MPGPVFDLDQGASCRRVYGSGNGEGLAMIRHKAASTLALVFALAAGPALAAEDTHHPKSPPAATSQQRMGPGGMMGQMGPGMMGPGMMGQGGMPMMGMMQRHVEGSIAFLKTELKITDAQLPLWNAVADAIRANAKSG